MTRAVVCDSSAIIHLAHISYLPVLRELYDKVYCARGVVREIKYPESAIDFVLNSAIVVEVADRSLLEAVRSVHPRLGEGELETYQVYLDQNADEMLFQNTQAQNIFSQEYRARVRDLLFLPEADPLRHIFKTEGDIDQFYLLLSTRIPANKRLKNILTARGLRS